MFENKELQNFHTDLQEEVKSILVSEDEGSNPDQIFTELSLSLLADSGETENYRASYDEKVSKRGIEHKVNAYAVYETYETLDLFVTLYYEYETIQLVSKKEAEKELSRAYKFFKNAVQNDYVTKIEESSEIFDLAHTLANLEDVRNNLTRVNIFLLTNGEIKSDTKFSEKTGQYSIFYRVIDINYLFNISDKSRIPIEIDFSKNGFHVPCIGSTTKNEDYQSYLAIIPGDALVEIYEQYGPRLLEQNVRSFLQFTGKSNRGIRNTILKEPHMFLAFNNGIAATAETIDLIDLPSTGGQGVGYVKDFQIVNGGQTTASIYHASKQNKHVDISQIFVQLKITIIKNKDNFESIVSRIAEYANTQSKVSASDLSSNRKNHIELENLSRTIWAPPKKDQVQQTRWFFERARGQYKNARLREGFTPSRKKSFDLKNPKSQVLTKEKVAKYINSWKEVYDGNKLVIGPHVVVRGNQKNYAQFLNYNYGKLPDSVFFEDTVAKAIIFKTSEKIYGVKPNALGDMRYIIVPYTISWLGFKLNYKLDLYEIWRRQEISNLLKETIKEIMIEIETFIKDNAPGSLYGEWAKKEECWNKVKTQNFGINLDVLSADLENEDSPRRINLEKTDIEKRLIDSELALIKSIPLNKWDEIGKMGTYIKELNPNFRSRAVNIMSTIKMNKKISEKQRKDAIKIIDIVVHHSPDFFDESKKDESKNNSKNNLDPSQITPTLIMKMVEWDTKARVLSPKELRYVSNFAYGHKKITSFHRVNLARYLQTLIKAGFNP